MFAKLILARLPISYRDWRAIGVFRHGSMLDAEYAQKVFLRHYNRAKSYLPPDFVILEVGPGDSLSTSVIAAAYGATKVYLIDVGSFASRRIEAYNQLRQALARRLPSAASLRSWRTVSEMLDATHTTYLVSGLESLKSIPDRSVDFVFSQAVLEHITLSEFVETVDELYRLQKPGGIASHRIDLQDHLAHSLNSLRFPHSLWESKRFAASGFYTNRLRAGQIVEIFTTAGYHVLDEQEDKWPALPLNRAKLHCDYTRFSDDELIIRGLDILVQKQNRADAY
jgi:hypothetical protein